MRKFDFIAIFVLNILLFALIALGDLGTGNILGFLRIVLGVSYLLFVPGYVLQAALFPHPVHLSSLDRFAFSVGLSIAVMPILGLVLDGPPGGIFLWQSLVFLTSFTVLCSLVALYRRSRLPAGEFQTVETELSLRDWWSSQNLVGRSLFIGMPVVVVVGFMLVIYVLLAPTPDKHFTEFSILDSSGVAANYPLGIKTGQPFMLKTSVTNHEGQNVNYSIRAQMNGQILVGTAPFTLNDGQSISLDINLTASTPGDQQLLEILLLRDNQTYRRLYLRLNVKLP
jgi:uncharacterized membrane protein